MKSLLALAALAFVTSSPAHAQAYVGSSSSAYGSSINSGQNGMAKAFFPTHYSLPDASSQMLIISGTDTEFVPSLFMSYDKAVATGVAELAVKPKTLAEVAAANRKEQHLKAQASFSQDANGNIIKTE